MRLQFLLFVLEVILRHFSRDRGFLTQRASFTITTATPRRQKSSRLRGFPEQPSPLDLFWKTT